MLVSSDLDKNPALFKICWVAELSTGQVCCVCQLRQAKGWWCVLAASVHAPDPFLFSVWTVLTCRVVIGHACDIQP